MPDYDARALRLFSSRSWSRHTREKQEMSFPKFVEFASYTYSYAESGENCLNTIELPEKEKELRGMDNDMRE